MRRTITFILFIGLWFADLALTATAQNFEGIIYYQIPEMTNQGMDKMPYMIKGSKARIEFGQDQQKGAMILLPEQSRFVFVIDAMKSYMSMNYDDVVDDNSFSEEHTSITKTGEMKTIAGKSCEVWEITSDKDNVEACMAKGLGTFMIPQNPMSKKNTPAWAQEIINAKIMPLEVLELNDDGSKTTQMKAIRIEEKTLSPDLFEIPEGYKDISALMKQMRNQNNK